MRRCNILSAALVAAVGAMLSFGVWVSVSHWPVEGASIAVPIGPGRQVGVEFWTHDLAFSASYSTGGLTRQQPGPLRVRVSYEHPAAGMHKRLTVLRVPTSPLVLFGGSMALAAFWLGLRWVIRDASLT